MAANPPFADALARFVFEHSAVRGAIVSLDGACREILDCHPYPPALRRVLPNSEHRRHKRLNNRAENSHRPVRKRERAMQRFKSPEQAQCFLETFSAVCNHFRPRRHRLSAERYRQIMRERFRQWREIACLAPTA